MILEQAPFWFPYCLVKKLTRCGWNQGSWSRSGSGRTSHSRSPEATHLLDSPGKSPHLTCCVFGICENATQASVWMKGKEKVKWKCFKWIISQNVGGSVFVVNSFHYHYGWINCLVHMAALWPWQVACFLPFLQPRLPLAPPRLVYVMGTCSLPPFIPARCSLEGDCSLPLAFQTPGVPRALSSALLPPTHSPGNDHPQLGLQLLSAWWCFPNLYLQPSSFWSMHLHSAVPQELQSHYVQSQIFFSNPVLSSAFLSLCWYHPLSDHLSQRAGSHLWFYPSLHIWGHKPNQFYLLIFFRSTHFSPFNAFILDQNLPYNPSPCPWPHHPPRGLPRCWWWPVAITALNSWQQPIPSALIYMVKLSPVLSPLSEAASAPSPGLTVGPGPLGVGIGWDGSYGKDAAKICISKDCFMMKK